MGWLLLALFVLAVIGTGYCCLFLSGTISQREEDRYDDEARRS
jgi:hypothetical protein